MNEIPLRTAIGLVVRSLRQSLGLSQSDLAEKAGMEQAWHISKLENSKWSDDRMNETLELIVGHLNTTSTAVNAAAKKLIKAKNVPEDSEEKTRFIAKLVKNKKVAAEPAETVSELPEARPVEGEPQGVEAAPEAVVSEPVAEEPVAEPPVAEQPIPAEVQVEKPEPEQPVVQPELEVEQPVVQAVAEPEPPVEPAAAAPEVEAVEREVRPRRSAPRASSASRSTLDLCIDFTETHLLSRLEDDAEELEVFEIQALAEALLNLETVKDHRAARKSS